MSFIKKYRLQIIVLVIMAVTSGGIFLYQKNIKNPNSQTDSKPGEESANEGKRDIGVVQKDEPQTTPVPDGGVVETAETAELKDIILTAYLYDNGFQEFPAGAIVPYFYMPAGVYTIQQKDSSSWKDLVFNQNYPGYGGLTAQYIGKNINSSTYRVLRVENGKITAISKLFTVNRADLSSGVKTYN